MSLPVRCFTCNKVIGQYEEKYNKIVENKKSVEKFFVKNGIERYCCRRMFLGYVNIFEKIINYEKK